jgi:iron(III) transport system substrate-binding protein
MILERGEEATLAWLEQLAASEPVIFDGNSPIVEATDAGEIQGGLVNHYYLLRLQAEGGGANAANWYIPGGDVGTLIMPAGVGILSGTDHPEAAERFVRFLLATGAQEYFATETFEYPLIDGVTLDGATPLDDIDSPDIDLSELADVLDDATRLVTEAGLV